MTLIVSLRIPDGIVIAGDSLATMMSLIQIQGNFDVTCPKCGENHPFSAPAGQIPIPATSFSYSQKVFPFLGKFGVGTFGMGQLMGETMYFAMRELEREIKDKSQEPATASEAATLIGNRAQSLLTSQLQSQGQDINAAQPNWQPLGFQVVGYDGDVATTVEVLVGNPVAFNPIVGAGLTYSGQGSVVHALKGVYQANPNESPSYDVFSLQDAIAFAEFLIGTTASHQRFSRTLPGVGGEIDIALVTPFDDYKWIRQKSLSRTLGE